MKVLFTTDVEAHRGKNPIESWIWGKSKDGSYNGLKKILEIFKKNNIVGIFFLDFAEFFDYSEDELKKVINILKEYNQEIGLHLHPDHFGNRQKTFMWEYSYEEQDSMIKKCINKYKEYVGKYPIFFRAGKFGANEDTLRALQNNGIKFDLSSFYNHRWCKIKNQIMINCPYEVYDGVVEIPVSVFKSLTLFNKNIRFDQYDLGNNNSEFISCLKKENNSDVIITAFLHSFSFFLDRRNPEKLTLSKKTQKTILKNIDNIKKNNIDIINPFEFEWNELYKKTIKSTKEINEYIPKSGNIFQQIYFTYVRSLQIIYTNKKAQIFILLINCFLVIVMALIIALIIFLWRI